MKARIDKFFLTETLYEYAKIVLFGAPFDSTTSFRPGTRFASRVMRSESFGLETYSPYLDKDLSDAKFYDAGDLELTFGDTKQALSDIKQFAKRILDEKKIPFLIGGEHLVSLPAIEAAADKYPDLRLIHFDAHTDLRDDYLGAKLSHATVIRRAYDVLGEGRIAQFGIRSGEREEFIFGKEHTNLHPFNFDGLEGHLKEIEGRPVYFTIDLDVLDPSVFPGTGTPEAGGVGFMELLNAAMLVIEKSKVVALDMVELSPHYDISGASTAVALKLLREMLIKRSAV